MKKIVVTNIPAFYKINLYNRINREIELYVIFTDAIEDDRNNDFVYGRIEFPYKILSGHFWGKVIQALNIVKLIDYDELILGGWDHIVLWVLALCFTKQKNACFIESSIHESSTKGLKGLLKKIFVKNISKVYVPGKAQRRILDELDFKGEVVITKGVGVFNYIQQPPYVPKSEVKKFFFVGRFVDVKNLRFLISIFNELPNYQLYLAGFGVLENELKRIAGNNIYFLGAINNIELPKYYQSMDVFILPSKVEPWGLVVEEALNNGLPVIVSDRVGCAEEIVNASNGIVFQYNCRDSLKVAIQNITELSFYNKLRENISKLDFEAVEQKQVDCYIR